MLHGRSALAWFELGSHNLAKLLVARPRDLTSTPTTLSELRQLRAVLPHHVVVVRGVPVERPLRAIWVEAARYASEPLFEIGLRNIGQLLDEAQRKHLVTWTELHQMIDEIHKQGRGGTVLMRTLAQERQPGTISTDSRLEDRFEEILRQKSVPMPRRQVPLGGVHHIGRIDFSYEDVPLAIEVNSETFHTTPTDVAADTARYRALNDAAFTVAVVWERDLWRRPAAVVETIENARRHASNGVAATIHSPGCPWPDLTLAA